MMVFFKSRLNAQQGGVSKVYRVLVLMGLLGLLCMAPVNAQPLTEGAENRELLRMGLYPPDLIMRHQQNLGITREQRKVITTLVKAFQNEVADLQWNLQNEQQILNAGLNTYPVAEADSLAQAEKLLALESEFKLAHFRLLIGIKNALSKEQVELIDQTLKQRRKKGRL